MKKYKVDLVARFVGFREIEVEADNELQARHEAYDVGQRLANAAQDGHVTEWDIQYVDWHNTSRRNRDGTAVSIYEVEINEIQEIL